MYFVIRISKDWVELRSHPTPIKGIKSSLVKTLPTTTQQDTQDGWHIPPGNYWYPEGVPRYVATSIPTTKKVTLTHTHWRGGKRLSSLPVTYLRGVCKTPTVGHAMTITTRQLKTLQNREHQKASQRNRRVYAASFDG